MNSDLQKLDKIFRQADRPLTFQNLRNRMKQESGHIHALIERYRKEFKLHSLGEGQNTLYTLDASQLAAKQARISSFPLPDELWRGWINPATGIIPNKLGL